MTTNSKSFCCSPQILTFKHNFNKWTVWHCPKWTWILSCNYRIYSRISRNIYDQILIKK